MLDDLFCCLRSLHVGAKNWNRIPKGAMGSVVCWWSYTCTLMCMLCVLVVVHNMSSGFG